MITYDGAIKMQQMKNVIHACKLACADEFIENLPE